MSLTATFNSNHPKAPKIATAVVLTTCAVLAGKIIFFDLPPGLKMPALLAFLAPAGTLALKIDEMASENEQFFGGAMLLTNGNLVVNWMDNHSETNVFYENPKETVSVLETLFKPRFFFDRLRDKEKKLSSIIGRQKVGSPVSQDLADHLEHGETQYQLKALAKEACNYAIDHTEKEICQSLNLQEQDTRYQFYTDVYFYLRVWLKNSIEYDMEMPDIGRSIKDISIYLKAFKFLQSERTDYFLVPDEQLKSDPNELVKVISQYLETLISRLESEEPGQGVFGRLLNPHR